MVWLVTHASQVCNMLYVVLIINQMGVFTNVRWAWHFIVTSIFFLLTKMVYSCLWMVQLKSIFILHRQPSHSNWGPQRSCAATEVTRIWWWRSWGFVPYFFWRCIEYTASCQACCVIMHNIHQEGSVQVSAPTWMTSISGLEWRTQRSWSLRPETLAQGWKCLPRSVPFISGIPSCNQSLMYLEFLLVWQEVKLVFPGAQRMNRGNHEINSLVQACKANNVTDLVIVHETRGQPGKQSNINLPSGAFK